MVTGNKIDDFKHCLQYTPKLPSKLTNIGAGILITIRTSQETNLQTTS